VFASLSGPETAIICRANIDNVPTNNICRRVPLACLSACERDLVMNEKNQFRTWFCNQTFETSVAPRVHCQLL